MGQSWNLGSLWQQLRQQAFTTKAILYSMALSPSSIWKLGSIYGLSAVALGAFGAHGLQSRGVSEQSIKNWNTASQYLLMHSVALLGISLHPRFSVSRYTAPLMALGVFMFSGSIYGLVLGSPSMRKVLGPITPIGGKDKTNMKQLILRASYDGRMDDHDTLADKP